MGIREDELAGVNTGSAANPNALRSRSPIASLASTISERAASTESGMARSALSATQPGAALNEAIQARAPRIALGEQPGAALKAAVAERAPRVAFNTQPGAALSEAADARMGPPTPARIRLTAQQPGAALAEAVAARTPSADASPMRVAQPRTGYSLTGNAPPPAQPTPQTAALLRPPTAEGAAHLSGAGAAQAPRTVAASAQSLLPREVIGAGLGTPAPAAPPAAVPDAPAMTPQGQAHLSGRTPVAVVRNPASAAALLPREMIGAGMASPAPAPAPAAAAGSPPLKPTQLPGTPQWPNPNTGGAGALSREAMNFRMGQEAFAGPTQSGTPLMPNAQGADRAGTAARLRSMLGLGQGGAGAPPVPPSVPPAAAGATPPAGGPGAIRSAANTLLGSGEDWARFGQSKGAQTALKVAKGVGTVAKVAAVPLAVNELATGIKEGDTNKMAWGGLDTAAAGAAFTPAAPVALAYGAVRGAYEGGQMLPEKVRDAIGSGVNKVANLFGGGVDKATTDNYARMQADYDARQLAQAQQAATAARGGAKPAAKAPPRTIADAAKAPGASTPAAAPMMAAPSAGAPRGVAAPDGQVAALTERYNSLQSQLDASPIARTILGGSQSAVYYKDGTVLNLQPGQALPDDVQQHLAIGNAMTQIENGQYRLPAASAPAAAPAGGNERVAAFAAQYGPAMANAAQRIGVDPNMLLAQFGHETGWGQSIIPGTNNLGNVKDFSGKGVAATDNLNGSRDKYMQFASPEAFADHYASLITRKYPGAVGAGNDMQRFAEALRKGGYAEDQNYVNGLMGAYRTLGGITASSSTPMQAPALAMLDGEAAPVAGAAPMAGERPPYAQGPVQILRGMQDTTALPNGGGTGYTEVPTSVYQAGVRGGNASLAGRGPIADYASNVAQGENFAANPAGARLTGETIKANSEERVANMRLEGERTKAQADRDVEASRADATRASTRNNIFYNEEQVGVDALGAPIIRKVPYTMGEKGAVRAVPEPKTYPVPNDAQLEQLRSNPGLAPQFDEKFGYGAAEKALKKKG